MNITDAGIVFLVLAMVIFAVFRSFIKKKSSESGNCSKCSFKDSCKKINNKK